MQPLLRQVLTRLGTTPRKVTRAACTNSPNGRPNGEPCSHTPSSGHSLVLTNGDRQGSNILSAAHACRAQRTSLAPKNQDTFT